MDITRHDDKGAELPRHAEQQAVPCEGERGVRASEERLRRSLEAAGLGHWTYDYVTDTLVWSEQTRKLLGVEPGEPASRALLRSRMHPEDCPRLEEYIARGAHFDADHIRHFEFRAFIKLVAKLDPPRAPRSHCQLTIRDGADMSGWSK